MYIDSKAERTFDLPTAEEEAEIRAGLDADEDAREFDDAQLRALRPVGRPKAAETKQAVSIRLSPEVLRFFRCTGKGWQTRIDDVLKAYVERQEH